MCQTVYFKQVVVIVLELQMLLLLLHLYHHRRLRPLSLIRPVSDKNTVYSMQAHVVVVIVLELQMLLPYWMLHLLLVLSSQEVAASFPYQACVVGVIVLERFRCCYNTECSTYYCTPRTLQYHLVMHPDEVIQHL